MTLIALFLYITTTQKEEQTEAEQERYEEILPPPQASPY
mgnify:CR=1 FL=1